MGPFDSIVVTIKSTFIRLYLNSVCLDDVFSSLRN